ncbi:sensor histidine kinase [Paenibacillus eucommiae]|uniref:Two-component system sensor histidine kinase YesM n=1 Tax=Paenibacillus eucommiae TaxID=1355755 RepID=A0ABS4IVG8_9BACL|nr:histidine kinase [Paenibacillus eucommiae]MBP1991581.1 two-component system sensor histidine kinase YesM [Paenibacillus eucommiae]
MTGKPTIFSKVIVLIVLLLTPVLILYIYTNKVSMDVVRDQIESSSISQLSFFLQQLDTTVEQLAMFPGILSSDPYLSEFVDHRSDKPYDRLKEQTRLMQKLSLQSVSSAWTNDLTLYLPGDRMVISSNIFKDYSSEDVNKFAPLTNWSYDATVRGDARTPGARFVRQIVDPVHATQASEINAMIQVSFPVTNVSSMLDQVKTGGKGDPFLYRNGFPPIGSKTMNDSFVKDLNSLLDGQVMQDSGRLVTTLAGREVKIYYVKSKQLGWYLVDYVPVASILAPIRETNAFFYTTLGMLLAMSLLAAYLLYRNVQKPIGKLVRGVQLLKKGDLSARISYRPHNEFDFLFERFNEMAEQIQDLVQRVYAEKIRLHEATLKQLQAQINPHFLYNSLFFIVNTALLQDTKSVVAMAQNLAEYYRYTTRMEDRTAPLREELKLVDNYLTIHNLRLQRLHYEIGVPEAMLDLQLPRLLLQPIVENAIVHGIENKPGEGIIRITGVIYDESCEIVVEDNGVGMADETFAQMERQLVLQREASSGFGVWNVNQRLHYVFGEGAGLRLSHSPLGGLRVTLTWRRDSAHGTAIDRG